MELLSSLQINALEWAIIMACGMLIGMSKVGVPGVSMIVVPALAFLSALSNGFLFLENSPCDLPL